ncbi:MAG: ATP-binding protein [Actinobacteria bacterium]|nr:ATP-binding protein [Actinomycetota bacterium]
MKRMNPFNNSKKLKVEFPCRKKSLKKARLRVEDFAIANGFEPEASDIALATQEALKNVIQHACPIDNRMRLEGTAEDNYLTIIVSDTGKGFEQCALDAGPSSPLSVHGRGLQLIKGVMDEMDIDTCKDGTAIRMIKRKHGV